MTEIPEIYPISVHVLFPGIEVETIQPILYRQYMIINRPFFSWNWFGPCIIRISLIKPWKWLCLDDVIMTLFSDDLYYLDYWHDNDVELQDTISIRDNKYNLFGYNMILYSFQLGFFIQNIFFGTCKDYNMLYV